MNQEELRELLENAMQLAKQDKKNLSREVGVRNQQKSRRFVRNLAEEFKNSSRYKNDKTIQVASAGNPKEFLHDISIKKVASTPSPKKRAEIKRIVDVKWQIEVEMSDRAQNFMEDLNKLSAGTSK